MKVGVFSALILRHPSAASVLLLQRGPTRRLFPNLITGIGGKVELADGEGEDLTASLLREFDEETRIPRETLADVRCRLSTLLTRGDLQVLLLWFSGRLTQAPLDLSCTEGRLAFYPVERLPLDAMIPTARRAIPFILALPDSDRTVYNGTFDRDGKLITNQHR